MYHFKKFLARFLNILISLLFIGNSVLASLAGFKPLPVQSDTDVTHPVPRVESGLATVSIEDFAFVPAVITVTIATEVTWINNGSVVHQVKSGFPPEVTSTPNPTYTSTATNTPTSTPTVTGTPPTPVSTPTATPLPPTWRVYLPIMLRDQNPPAGFWIEASSPSLQISQEPSLINGEPGDSRIARGAGGEQLDMSTPQTLSPSPRTLTWDSGPLSPGESFSFTFEAGGVYDYYDPLYPEMTGQVVVVPNTTPVVMILTPEEGAVVGANVQVTGSVSDDGTVASVLVNDIPATLNGNLFDATILLDAGNQAIHVVAEDNLGATGFASRLVGVDSDGPMITVQAPKDRQAVYTLNPTVTISYSDFYTGVNPASLSVILTDESGLPQDVTSDLSITNTGASGTVSAALSEETTYTMTVSLADTLGNLGNAEISFYVPTDANNIVPPDEPPGAGWVSGVIYDSSTCNEYLITCQGLAGAEVTLARVDTETLATVRAARQAQLAANDYREPLAPMGILTANTALTGTVITGPDGFFAFPAGETGHYWLRAEKNGYTYSQREIDIVREHSTTTNDLYLTPLDPAITPCDESGCSHTNSDNTLQLTIPPGAIPSGQIVDVNATYFEQVEFLPSGELPPGTWETYAFNLGGASEITFTMPITVQVANSLGFAPGTPVPVGYWNQATQAWEHAGTGTVDSTGQWVVLQVTHFSNYDCNDPITIADIVLEIEDQTDDDEDECEGGEGGCFINFKSGEFEETIALPTVNVLGEAVAPQLVYNSNRASPSQVIDVSLSLEYVGRTLQLENYIGFELYIEGQKTDSFSFASDLASGELGRFRYLWDGHDAQGNLLPPGVYDYQVKFSIPYSAQYCYALDGIFGNLPDCVNGATGIFVVAKQDIWTNGTLALDSQVKTPLGAGFALEGMQRLSEDEAGHILVADAQRNDEFYFPYKDLLSGQGGITVTQSNLFWTSFGSHYIQMVPVNLAIADGDLDISVGEGPYPGGPYPYGVALSPDGTFAYVTNNGSDTLSVVDLALQQQVATIGVGSGPQGIVLSPDGAFAYVTNNGSDTVSVVDLALQQQVAAIGVGNWPQGIALSLDGTIAYVTNNVSDTVSVVDLALQQQVAAISVGDGPRGLTLTSDGAFAYVTNVSSGTVSVVDLALQQQVATIGVGVFPQRIALSPDEAFAYVTNYGSHTVSVVDLALQQQVATIGLDFFSHDIALSPDGVYAYVTMGASGSSSDGYVSVVDLALQQQVAIIGMGNDTEGIALSPDGMYAYVTHNSLPNGILSVVDLALQQQITTVGVGNDPYGIVLGPNGAFAYVTNWSDDSVSVVDMALQQEVATIGVGNVPRGIALAPNGAFAYVTNWSDDSVSVVDMALQQEVATIGVGNDPQGIALAPNGAFAYVTGGSGVSVVDLALQQQVATIGAGSFPWDVVLSLDGSFAYVTNYLSDNVSVIDLVLQQQVATIGVGDGPRGIALSPDGAFAYVTNYLSDNVSVIDLALQQQVATVGVGDGPQGIVLHPDGAFAYVTNAEDHTVSVVDLTTWQQVGFFRTASAPSGIAVSGILGFSPAASSRTATDYSTLTYITATQTYSRTYPTGEIVHFNSDGSHDHTLESDGRKTAYTYNPDGSVATMEIFAPGESSPRWVWTFNYLNGKLDSLLDPAGRVTTFTLDGQGNLVQATTPDGGTQGFAYDPNHLMTHYTDQTGAITTHVYDAYGRIASLLEPPRAVYDPLTGETTVMQEVKTFTPSDTGYPLINDSPVGDPGNPAPSVPHSAELVDRIEYGQGARSGHTNKWGRWLDETDGVGRTTYHQYNDENKLTRTDFPDGDCVAYTYDDHGNMLTQSRINATGCANPGSGLAQTWTHTYENQFDQVKTATDPNGNATTYVYDYEEGAGNAGNLIRVEYPQIQDETGQWVTPMEHFTYNSLGLVETKTDARGTVTRYEYTPEGWLEQVIEDDGGLNQTTTYQDFDLAGNPQTVIFPSCCGLQRVVHYTYDAMNRVRTETDALGNVIEYAYDGRGNVIQKVTTYTDADNQVRSVTTYSTYNAHDQITSDYTAADGLLVGMWYNYDINRNLSTVTDGNHHTTTYRYDDANQLVSEADPAGYSRFYTYYPDGLSETITDARGHITKYMYDGLGRLVSEIQDFGGLNLTTTYTYDPNGNLLTTTDPVGTVTRYEYDALNRRIIEVQDEGGFALTTQYAHDLNGNLAKVIDARGVVTLMEYDPLNRFIQITLDANTLSLEITFQYNSAGNLESLTDERGVVTYYEYDALNRVILFQEDENGLALNTTYAYDGMGNLVTVTDPNDITTRTAFNFFGVPVQVIRDDGGLSTTTTYTYDNRLNVIRVTDANGNVTTHEYESRDLLAAITYADTTTVVNTYDENGNLTMRWDQSGNLITYAYDGVNRLISRTFPNGSQTFTYDDAGQMTSAGESANGHTSLLTWIYNPLGDVESTTQTLDGVTYTVGFAYDYYSGTTTTIYPSGAEVTHNLDPIARLEQVTQNGLPLADYAYDDLNGLYTLTYANGTSTRTETDSLRRITRVWTQTGANTLADYQYGYDDAGNRTYVRRTHQPGQPADVYKYDSLYQLTQAWYGADATDPSLITAYDHLQWYDLDELGNRLEVQNDGISEIYLPNDGQQLTDPMNRYEQVGTDPFAYDLRGNTLMDGRNVYDYDLLNRQLSMTGPEGDAEYFYDALGRRIAKIVDGVMIHYVYDAQYRVLEERNADETLAATYVYGAEIDEVLTMERAGKTYYYHRDALTSITEITDNTGSLVERYVYDVYGIPYRFDEAGNSLTISGIGNPYLFTARHYDLESGNYYFRARMYSPSVGRFLQMDPIGAVDGPNLYTYALNRPTSLLDPMGLTVRGKWIDGPALQSLRLEFLGFDFSIRKLFGLVPYGVLVWLKFRVSAEVFGTVECEELCEDGTVKRSWTIPFNFPVSKEFAYPALSIEFTPVWWLRVLNIASTIIKNRDNIRRAAQTFEPALEVARQSANLICEGDFDQAQFLQHVSDIVFTP